MITNKQMFSIYDYVKENAKRGLSNIFVIDYCYKTIDINVSTALNVPSGMINDLLLIIDCKERNYDADKYTFMLYLNNENNFYNFDITKLEIGYGEMGKRISTIIDIDTVIVDNDLCIRKDYISSAPWYYDLLYIILEKMVEVTDKLK